MKKLLVLAVVALIGVGFMGCNSSNQKEVKTLQDSITVLNTKIVNMGKAIDSLKTINDSLTTVKQNNKKTTPKPKKKVVKKHKI